MSAITICPTCGGKSKVKNVKGTISYQAMQDEEAFQKIQQLKKAMQKWKDKAENLEQRLTDMMQKKNI